MVHPPIAEAVCHTCKKVLAVSPYTSFCDSRRAAHDKTHDTETRIMSTDRATRYVRHGASYSKEA